MTDATVSNTTPLLTNNDEVLRDVRSFEDAIALLAGAGVAVVDYSEEYGDGFTLLKGNDDKQKLVNEPFVILGIKLATGDYGDGEEFAILHVVTKSNQKFILVDGGSGICAQAIAMIDRGHSAGVYVPNGLRRSDYEYVDEKGKRSPASTFYLSN